MGQGIDLIGAATRIRPERIARPVDGAALRHVLIVKLSSLGDIVHALPVASALKRRHPSMRISWAVERWAAALVEGHRAVDRVVVFPSMMAWPDQPRAWWSAMRAAVAELRRERYDAVLDLQGLAKSAVVSMLSRAPIRLARQGQREGAHLVSAGVPLPATPMHAVDEYLLVAAALGAAPDPVEFGLPVSADARASVSRLLSAQGVSDGDALVVVSPSAGGRWKQWPAPRWSELIDRLGHAGTFVIIGSASQAPVHREIADRVRLRPIDLTGKTTLAEAMALIERAALHLSPDTGTMHVAVALGRPVVGIYGPTSPVRLGPYRQAAAVVAHGELCGRGCPAYCRFGRRCLEAVTVDEVVERARLALSSAGRVDGRGGRPSRD